MVGERNNRRAHTQDHRRVNLAMCERCLLGLLRVEVLQLHGDHSSLLFFDIQEFNQTFLATSFEVPATFRRLGILLVEDLLDVPLSHL